MQGEKKEYWRGLCEKIADEQDPVKFNQLVIELNRLLAEKDFRLKDQGKQPIPNRDAQPRRNGRGGRSVLTDSQGEMMDRVLTHP